MGIVCVAVGHPGVTPIAGGGGGGGALGDGILLPPLEGGAVVGGSLEARFADGGYEERDGYQEYHETY